MNGISWDVDEGVKLDTLTFSERYKELIKKFEVKLDQFIYDTQK